MANNNQKNNKSNQAFTAKIVVGSIVVIILVVALFVVSNSVHNNASLSPFKTHYLSSFMQSCEKVEGDTSTPICTCIGNHLLASYTNAQLMSISVQYRTTGRIPQQVSNAAEICRSSK